MHICTTQMLHTLHTVNNTFINTHYTQETLHTTHKHVSCLHISFGNYTHTHTCTCLGNNTNNTSFSLICPLCLSLGVLLRHSISASHAFFCVWVLTSFKKYKLSIKTGPSTYFIRSFYGFIFYLILINILESTGWSWH